MKFRLRLCRNKKGNKKDFRVKDKLDNHSFFRAALLPMSSGNFILPFNAVMRKAIGKGKNDRVKVQLEEDTSEFVFNADFMACLGDEPDAQKFFNALSCSHHRYFSKWIDSAKTDNTKTKRIAQAVNVFVRKKGFGEMLRDARITRRRDNAMFIPYACSFFQEIISHHAPHFVRYLFSLSTFKCL